MKRLTSMVSTDSHARLAVDMFGYAVKKAIGAFVAALGGIDLLIFTGGIGEHAPQIRAAACADLGFLGIVLDDARNTNNASTISSNSSRCTVQVVPSNEEVIIARHTRAVLAGRDDSWVRRADLQNVQPHPMCALFARRLRKAFVWNTQS
jgi:acetate kinase